MIPTGRWAWWNQYGHLSLEACIQRAAQVEGIITKALFWGEFEAFKQAGIRLGIERYVYPSQPTQEARWLAEGVRRGAEFIVINAEVGWEEAGDAGGHAMQRLIDELALLAPGVERYASVDTRGGRTYMPYQQVLGAGCNGWMPMIYPLAFRPHRPDGYVTAAFNDCLESGQDFQGKPVLPTIQTYDNITLAGVQSQLEQVSARGLEGCQAYTIGHAMPLAWTQFTIGYVPGKDAEEMWLDTTIVGFDGEPVLFTVIVGGPPDLPTEQRSLTHRQWIQLTELGLIISDGAGHQHTGTVVVT